MKAGQQLHVQRIIRRKIPLLVFAISLAMIRLLWHFLFVRGVITMHSVDSTGRSDSTTVVCMLFTTPTNWNRKGTAVLQTWARHCHRRVIFYSKFPDYKTHDIFKTPDTMALDVPDGRRHLTAKTLAALNYSYSRYGDVADWFMKADDDVYVIWENLMWYLRQFNPAKPHYMGYIYKSHLSKGYNSGGASYLISKSIVYRFLRTCSAQLGHEDVEVGRCLAKHKLYPTNTSDNSGRIRFHPGRFTVPIKKDLPVLDVFSQTSITFHYTQPAEMYMFDYLLHNFNRAEHG